MGRTGTSRSCPSAHGVRSMRLLGSAGAPTRSQQSNTDQQMSFHNRWSSRTSSRIASGSWSRCHRHSSHPALSPSPSGAAARAALVAYAAAPSSCAATCATAAAWPAAYAVCRAAPLRFLAAAFAWPAAVRAWDIVISARTQARACSIAWRGRGSSGSADSKRSRTCSAHDAAHRARS